MTLPILLGIFVSMGIIVVALAVCEDRRRATAQRRSRSPLPKVWRDVTLPPPAAPKRTMYRGRPYDWLLEKEDDDARFD